MKKNIDQRFALTIGWTLFAGIVVIYSLVVYGRAHLEIVTFILGIVSNQLLGGPNGVYFGGNHSKPSAPAGSPDATTVEATATVSTTSTSEA